MSRRDDESPSLVTMQGGAAFLREMERRAQEVESGKAELISPSLVKRRIARALRTARPVKKVRF